MSHLLLGLALDFDGVPSGELEHAVVPADVAVDDDARHRGDGGYDGLARAWILDDPPHGPELMTISLLRVVPHCVCRPDAVTESQRS